MSVLLKIAKEFAPGIPLGRKVKRLPTVRRPQRWKMVIQRHKAERAGEHFDLRLIDMRGRAHSWALPKARMPRPGEKVLAVRQPTHTKEYALNFGKGGWEEIESGYGKGKVRIERTEDIEVEKASERGDHLISFNSYAGRGPQEYVIIRTNNRNCLLINVTNSKKKTKALNKLPLGVSQRPKRKSKDPKKIDLKNKDEWMMPKYDGAHTILHFEKGKKKPRLYSARIPKSRKTGVIEHTHKVDRLMKKKTPRSLEDTVVRAETIGIDKRTKRAIPARELGGYLNSKVWKSREKQRREGVELKPVIHDVIRYKGKDVRKLPFKERHKIMKRIGRKYGIPAAEVAKNPYTKKRLLDKIQTGSHKMTDEGVILKPKSKDHIVKAKFRPDYDVWVRDIFEATDASGKPKGRAGGFEYSWTKHGPVVGRVGTGFSHAEARKMWKNKKDYIGRVAKVKAQRKMPSGALFGASFQEWHLDKGKS